MTWVLSAVYAVDDPSIATAVEVLLDPEMLTLQDADVGVEADVHYVALFRYLGCSGYAHEEALVGAGDDQRMLAVLEVADGGRPATVLKATFTRLAADEGFSARARVIARLLSDPKGFSALARA